MKKIQTFVIGQEIPTHAVFLSADIEKEIFYYEVPVKSERAKINVENYSKEIEVIVAHLNSHTGKKYSHKTEKTRKLIFKWLKQGYKVADFYIAIDNMVEEWGDDPKWSRYLRPETLFGSKFEGYYNKNSGNQENAFDELDNIMSGIE